MKKIFALLITTLLLTSCGIEKEVSTETNDLVNNEVSTENNGNRTYVGFVSTTCPHCQNEMPILDKFYSEHSDNVNMQIIVTNGLKFPGDYSIPQDLTNPVSYESLTQESCGYIPSYVIYDENKKIIDKKCGGALSYEELEKILITNNKKEDMTNFDQTAKLQNGDVVAVMKTTNGTMKIKLFTQKVPMTTANFIGLAKQGYYDGIIFHRVINNFMIQGGDPTGTGMGGHSIYGEKFDDEFDNDLKNIKYSIAMANSGANTNGSQFFINQAVNSHLDNRHSVFGQVVEGMDNVDKIAKAKTGQQDKPEKEIKIISLEIKEFNNGVLSDYDFDLEETLKKIEEDKNNKIEANKNKVVKNGDNISMHYTGTLENGEKFDSSYDRGATLDFIAGAGEMIKGFDKGVIGMKIGEKKTLTLAPADAYGEYSEENIQIVPKDQLTSFTEAGVKLEKGEVLRTQVGEFTILEADESNVTLDVNHKLAGKTLIFDIELVNIK